MVLTDIFLLAKMAILFSFLYQVGIQKVGLMGIRMSLVG